MLRGLVRSLVRTMSSKVGSSEDVRPVSGRSFTLALVQLGNIGKDKTANLSHARDMIHKAAKGHPSGRSDVVVLPECFNSPYGVDYFPEYAETIGFEEVQQYDVATSKSESVRMLSEAAKETQTWLFGGSIPERDASNTKRLYNTALVFNPSGQLIATHRKLHLFDIDIPGGITFKESTTLTGGDKVTLVETDFGKIGLGVCYDIRFPEMAMICARRGAIAYLLPGAFNTTTGPIYWELLQRARAVDNQLFVATCSPARAKDGYPAYGHSMLVDPTGKVMAQTDEKESIVYGKVDTEVINTTRRNVPVTVQRIFGAYPDVSK